MKKLATLIALCLFAAPAPAQSIAERLDRLEAQAAKIDALSAKVDALGKGVMPGKMPATCICPQGKCACPNGKLCDDGTCLAPSSARSRIHCYCGSDPLQCSCTVDKCQCFNGGSCVTQKGRYEVWTDGKSYWVPEGYRLAAPDPAQSFDSAYGGASQARGRLFAGRLRGGCSNGSCR